MGTQPGAKVRLTAGYWSGITGTIVGPFKGDEWFVRVEEVAEEWQARALGGRPLGREGVFSPREFEVIA